MIRLIEGKAIIIQGGTFITENYWYKCGDCFETMNTLKPIKQCRKCDSGKITRLNNESDDASK
jgi:rRNA maturation endonuclease Nob1